MKYEHSFERSPLWPLNTNPPDILMVPLKEENHANCHVIPISPGSKDNISGQDDGPIANGWLYVQNYNVPVTKNHRSLMQIFYLNSILNVINYISSRKHLTITLKIYAKKKKNKILPIILFHEEN